VYIQYGVHIQGTVDLVAGITQCVRILWPMHSTACRWPQTTWYGRWACNTSRKWVVGFTPLLIYYRRQNARNQTTTLDYGAGRFQLLFSCP